MTEFFPNGVNNMNFKHPPPEPQRKKIIGKGVTEFTINGKTQEPKTPQPKNKSLDPRKYSPDDDTIVQCRTCGRRQYLQFINGLKNGWGKCCGHTMEIIVMDANIDDAVKKTVGVGLLKRMQKSLGEMYRRY